jgi:xanthine dehydrogenase YagT iron-sulfur-binding subunit
MPQEKSLNQQQEESTSNESRRSFLKQSSILTAFAVVPSSLVKATESELDEKVASYFEKVPLSIEVNGRSQQLSNERNKFGLSVRVTFQNNFLHSVE